MASIGAHFPAQFGTARNSLPGTAGYESARAALAALLSAAKVRHLFIPAYVCSAVTEAAEAAGASVTRYAIGNDFAPLDLAPVGEGQAILIVDYFGLCRSIVERTVTELGAKRIIVDSSQAYFAPPAEGSLGTIYSLRKFLPVADGGRVTSKLELPNSPPDERGTIMRFQANLARVGSEPEDSRDAYLKSESSLSDISDRAMSRLTEEIASQLDLENIKSRRCNNFDRLANRLGQHNILTFKRGPQIPLCYPMMVSQDGLRQHLIANRIFAPTYWPGVEPLNSFEKALLERTAFLPIDHRYGADEVDNVAGIVSEFLERTSL